MFPRYKNRCIILCNRNCHLIDILHPLIILHFHYVFMQLFWSLYRRHLPFLWCSASHTLSLSFSLVVSSLSLPFCFTLKMHDNLLWIIIDFNEVVWQTSRCFTYERLITRNHHLTIECHSLYADCRMFYYNAKFCWAECRFGMITL
jgi:hypothetical protein